MESSALAGLCAVQEGRKECLREISLTQKVTPARTEAEYETCQAVATEEQNHPGREQKTTKNKVILNM